MEPLLPRLPISPLTAFLLKKIKPTLEVRGNWCGLHAALSFFINIKPPTHFVWASLTMHACYPPPNWHKIYSVCGCAARFNKLCNNIRRIKRMDECGTGARSSFSTGKSKKLLVGCGEREREIRYVLNDEGSAGRPAAPYISHKPPPYDSWAAHVHGYHFITLMHTCSLRVCN
jgi:hypothetical protein